MVGLFPEPTMGRLYRMRLYGSLPQTDQLNG
jgi:hypothetical protein